MSYLTFVNGLGPDYKGNNLYEFMLKSLGKIFIYNKYINI